MMETAGLWMLLCVGVGLLLTGLPAWVVLLAVATGFSAAGLWTGVVSMPILTALAPRLIGLLEQDLLQALPLYVLMGALLNRLPLASILFKVGSYALRGTRNGPQLMSLILGVMLAPINGSVGASVSMVSRTVQARLQAASVQPENSAAVICVASTFGVVIPPSLVLILLGDAMMRAHTEALNATHQAVRIINTQDVFRGALLPAALVFGLCLLIAGWSDRRADTLPPAVEKPRRSDWLIAAVTLVLLAGLLIGVSLGYFYAVEGAAAGGLGLVTFGMATRTLTMPVLRQVLRDTMALSGALFALLVAATMFTLVLRIFGTDRWVTTFITELGGGEYLVLAPVLAILALCALVLDAFEIIFVVIPVVIPPLLMRVPDATWVATIALLILQASFLIPPLGYAVLLIRGEMTRPVSMRRLARILIPYLIALLAVLALVIAFPQTTHLFGQPQELSPVQQQPGGEDDAWRLLQEQMEQPDGNPSRE